VSLQGFDPTGRASGTGIITSSTPDPKGARVPLAGGIAKQSQFTISSQKQLVEQYRKMSPAMRRALSQKLKDAGYQTPVTDQYNASVRQAFLDASSDLSAEINYLRTNDPAALEAGTIDLNTFLGQRSTGTGGEGRKPSRFTQKVNLRPESIEATIDEVIRSYTGRGATVEELAKWSGKINAQLEKPKNFAETITTPQGETATFQEITPAFSPKEYLFQQIAKTDEAKANKVFGFYNAFKRALGVS
jgi:hypothetical protein